MPLGLIRHVVAKDDVDDVVDPHSFCAVFRLATSCKGSMNSALIGNILVGIDGSYLRLREKRELRK